MASTANVLRFDDVAPGRPFHAALVPVHPESRQPLQTHTHADFHELFFVLRGRGVQRINGTDMSLCAGDLVLVRPTDVHEFAGIGAEGMQFVNVAFPSTPWRAFAKLGGVDAVSWDRGPSPPSASNAGPVLAQSFFGALAAYARGPTAFDLFRLWVDVLPSLDHDGDAAPEVRPPWLVAACSAMAVEENLQRGLDGLRALACVSRGHLARSMAAHYGCTPVQFVTELRLSHATLLLTTTAQPVGVIAMRCGFESHSYFGRCFRLRYGLTPRDYRERGHRSVVPPRLSVGETHGPD